MDRILLSSDYDDTDDEYGDELSMKVVIGDSYTRSYDQALMDGYRQDT